MNEVSKVFEKCPTAQNLHVFGESDQEQVVTEFTRQNSGSPWSAFSIGRDEPTVVLAC